MSKSMEWRDISESRPPYDTACIVANMAGQLSIKKYCKYRVRRTTSGGGVYVIPVTPDTKADNEGFISKANTLDQSAAFYMELPELPDRYIKAEAIRAQIRQLKGELEKITKPEEVSNEY